VEETKLASEKTLTQSSSAPIGVNIDVELDPHIAQIFASPSDARASQSPLACTVELMTSEAKAKGLFTEGGILVSGRFVQSTDALGDILTRSVGDRAVPVVTLTPSWYATPPTCVFTRFPMSPSKVLLLQATDEPSVWELREPQDGTVYYLLRGIRAPADASIGQRGRVVEETKLASEKTLTQSSSAPSAHEALIFVGRIETDLSDQRSATDDVSTRGAPLDPNLARYVVPISVILLVALAATLALLCRSWRLKHDDSPPPQLPSVVADLAPARASHFFQCVPGGCSIGAKPGALQAAHVPHSSSLATEICTHWQADRGIALDRKQPVHSFNTESQC